MKQQDLESMREQWVAIYANRTHSTKEQAEAAFKREAHFFEVQTENTTDLKACTEISLKNTFINIAACGLSIQQGGKADAFLQVRGFKTGKKDERGYDIYDKACSLTITAYGELNMRIMSGQIVRASNPQVIYEGDIFRPYTNERGDLSVDYQPAIPRKSHKIIGCYIQLILPNNGRDFKWLLEDDFTRLAKYSDKANRGKGDLKAANALYTSDNGQIDAGFAEAKTIKAAMRAYTKQYIEDAVDDSISFQDENFEEQLAGEEADNTAPYGEPAAKKEDVSFKGEEGELF